MWEGGEKDVKEENDNDEISLGEVTFCAGIPLPFVLKFISKKVNRYKLLREVFVFVPFLIMFVFFATGGRNVTDDYYIGRVLRDKAIGNEIPTSGPKNSRVPREVTASFHDIAVVDDWYDWVEGVLIPNLWSCPQQQLSTQQGQNYLLGSLRIRTLRANRRSCKPDSQLFIPKGAPLPPLCEDIPAGNLWTPPSLDAIGTVKQCWKVSSEFGVRITVKSNEGSAFVRHLPAATPVQIAEITNDFVRLNSPVAGWSRLLNHTSFIPFFSKYDCPVECINCLGAFKASEEETSLRFNVSNPLVTDSEALYLEENRLYKWKSCADTVGGTYVVGDIDYYHCGGYNIDIPFNVTCKKVKDVIHILRGDGWEDLSTEPPARFVDDVQSRFAIVEYFTYTPQMNSFVSAKLYIEIGPSGVVLPQIQFRTFKMWTHDRDLGSTVYDFFFFVFVLYYVIYFFTEWRTNVQRTGKRFAFFLDDGGVWQLLEFINISIFMSVFAMRWVWWDVSTKVDGGSIPAVGYPKDLDYLKDLYLSQVYLNSSNIVLSFLKVLKFCQLNDKLNILTVTMGKSKDKVVGVLLLFAWSVLAYAIAGHTLFGGALYGFRNVNASYSTLLRMLLGDFDYEALRRENRFLAGAFFWTYCILALFLLLNFIIAIISEAFSEASSEVVEVPFHISIMRFKVAFARFIKPDNMINLLKLMIKRKSRGHLLERALDNMRSHQVHLDEEGVDEDDLVYRDKLKAYLGVDIYNLLGERYINDLWKELEEDYDFEMSNNPAEVEQRETSDLIEGGVDAAIAPCIDGISLMSNLVHELEANVEDLIQRIFEAKGRARKRV